MTSKIKNFIYHPYGINSGDPPKFAYVTNIRDHLGNLRMSITRDNNDKVILQERNYYPFGLLHQGYNEEKHEIKYTEAEEDKIFTPQVVAGHYKYWYNGKEWQEDLGLDMYDYGARQYDPAVGRWFVVDPLGEKFIDLSPFVYVANAPIKFVDPDGKQLSFKTNDYKDLLAFVKNYLNNDKLKGEIKINLSHDENGKMDGFIVSSYKPAEENEFSMALSTVVNSKKTINVILQHDDPAEIEKAESYGGAVFTSNNDGLYIYVMKEYLRENYYYAAKYYYYKSSHSFWKDDQFLYRNMTFFEGFMHEIIHADRFLRGKTADYFEEENAVRKIMNKYRRENNIIERGYIRPATFWEQLWGYWQMEEPKKID